MKSTFLFLFFLCAIAVNAADSLTLTRSIKVNAKLFTTDAVGNLYIVKDNNALIKYNARGDSIGFFNEIKKGKITQIDAGNPLRILLYFAEYGQIVMLDNMLSLKGVLKLPTLGIVNAPCIAASADGNIWVYDPAGMLVKINTKPEISFTTSLRNVLDKAIDPVFMVEQDRSLYMIDTLEGIKKFDQFGLFKTGFPFLTHELQVFNAYMVYYRSPYLISYNTLSMQEKKLLLPDAEQIIKVRVERDFVYVLRNESLDIYAWRTEDVR